MTIEQISIFDYLEDSQTKTEDQEHREMLETIEAEHKARIEFASRLWLQRLAEYKALVDKRREILIKMVEATELRELNSLKIQKEAIEEIMHEKYEIFCK